jgi:restriction system protein
MIIGDVVVRAWTVRGGRYGEREETALDEGLVILGWKNLGDLSKAASIDDVSAVLLAAYPASGPRTIDNWAHQLWRFIKVMQVGDGRVIATCPGREART